jgi:HSP20 family protein
MLILCPIAGVEKSDIKVAIQDDVLTIRGERKAIQGLGNKTPLVRELFWGTFSRSIVLPDHIDRKNIQARVHEHILIISIPKTEDFKTRIIHINDEA